MSDVERRMTEAAHAEKQGQYREAASLYARLGRDVQKEFGRFDPRALDAFEGQARAIRKGCTPTDN
jgi:hypothetical protein